MSRLPDDIRFITANTLDLETLEESPRFIGHIANVYRQIHPGLRRSLIHEVKLRCTQGDNTHQHLHRHAAAHLGHLVRGYVGRYSNMLLPLYPPYVDMIHLRDVIETYRLMNGGSWGIRAHPRDLATLRTLDDVMRTVTPTYRCSPLYWCGRPMPRWERRRRNWWVWWYASDRSRPVASASSMFNNFRGFVQQNPRRPGCSHAIPGYDPDSYSSHLKDDPYYPEVDFID